MVEHFIKPKSIFFFISTECIFFHKYGNNYLYVHHLYRAMKAMRFSLFTNENRRTILLFRTLNHIYTVDRKIKQLTSAYKLTHKSEYFRFYYFFLSEKWDQHSKHIVKVNTTPAPPPPPPPPPPQKKKNKKKTCYHNALQNFRLWGYMAYWGAVRIDCVFRIGCTPLIFYQFDLVVRDFSQKYYIFLRVMFCAPW